jgi:hypothetical protein
LSDEVITSVDQVTVEWLTNVLTQSGALMRGAVESFDVETGQLVRLSTNARLRVKYTDGSQGDRPQKLFLKMVKTDPVDGFFDDSEINYYFRDYVGLKDAPLVRAYDAAYSEAQRRYHLLLDDLSDTHTVAIYKTPTLAYGLALAEGLATLHTHWWGRARLVQADSPIPSAEVIRRFVSIAEPGAGYIIAGCADQLRPHWLDALRGLYANHPRLMIERTQDGSGFTLIHGDMNGFNILVPIEGDRPIYVIDRQPFDWSLTTWLGVYDLVFPMVLDWEVDIRKQLEKPILKHYHEHLIKHGVRDYSWEQLWYDYRLSAVISVYVMTEWSRNALNVDAMSIWMPILQRSLTAFDDLECAQLWQHQS